MNRRNLTLAVVPALALAACLFVTACGTSTTTGKTDVDLVADAVRVELPIILPALSPDQQAKATDYANQIEAARQAIDKTLATGGTVNAQTFVVALQALSPIVAQYLPTNSPAAIVIASAVSLVPLILEQAGGLPPTARTTNVPVAPVMARLVLRGAVAK